MTDLSPEAQRAIDRIDEQVADVQRRAEQAARLRDEVDALRGSATATGREVSVEVDSLGRLVGISFDAGAYNLPPRELGQVVLRTVAAARDQAGRAVMDRVEDAFGADSETAAALRSTYQPPTPPADEPAARPGPAGPPLFGRR
jgi:hypothetical protein